MGDVVRLTAELAGLTTVLLLILATPIAWWLARQDQQQDRRQPRQFGSEPDDVLHSPT